MKQAFVNVSRAWFFRLCVGSCGLFLSAAVLAQTAAPPVSATRPAATPGDDALTEWRILERVMTAADRGLEFLARQQQPDGRWADTHAANALTLLAFLGRGHTPGHGLYREALERGKRFLLSTQREDGLLQSPQSRGPMYEHALATLALAEMYGQDPDPRLEDGLRRAVTLIVNAQSAGGGWRYQPKPGDQDLSVSVMQIVALRAANNADVPVPEDTIRKAIGFVRSCTVAAGGFSYQPGGGLSPQMAAAGTLSLQLLGQYDDDRIGPAMEAVTGMPVVWGQSRIQYFFYFHYYAIQASYQAGGRNWNLWHPRVREMVLAGQQADGHWALPPGYSNEPGEIYPTAMATLILEIYMHYLPAYQR